MSTPTASASTSSSPTTTDQPPTTATTTTHYYNYLFLFLAAAILLLSLLLLYYLRRRRQHALSRRQQNGRAALIRDVARLSRDPHHSSGSGGHSGAEPFFWSRRSVSLYSQDEQQHSRAGSSPRDPELEAGLDERGEAPPPYGAAGGTAGAGTASTRVVEPDKAVFVPGSESAGVGAGGLLGGVQWQQQHQQPQQQQQHHQEGSPYIDNRDNRRQLAPPGYDWRSRAAEEAAAAGRGVLLPARPAAVVTVVGLDVGVDDRSPARDARRPARSRGVFAKW